jgi:acyl carrier protein
VIPREQIRHLVIAAILDNQEESARAIPDIEQITDDFCPLGDLDGFDSYSAMETVLELSDRLGCEIDERIFLTRVGDRRANVGEIVGSLFRIVNAKEADSDGE